MYTLLTDSKKPIQQYELNGHVNEVQFDAENVLKGNLGYSNQCSNNSEFRLGGAYVGQLDITLLNIDIPRNEWRGQEITPNVIIGETEIPVGVFAIDKANHTKNMVSIVAYDNMIKFDKACGTMEGTNGSAYNLLMLACQECHVELGMTQAQVEALPNGTQPFVLNEMGDIETWRDFIYWLAVSLGSFATMDRMGQLVLRTFHSSVDDTIDYDVRYNNSVYGDEIIKYTGINCVVSETQTIEYYHAEVDDGYTLNIGNNPFFQVSQIQRQHYIENILEALSEIQFNTCSVIIPFGFHYDLGDVLKFPNGRGSATNLFCVMGFSFNYNGECKLTGIPGQKNSKSKTDKNLQGLLSTVGRNEFTSYELRNTAPITINDNETARLLMARIASNTNTKAQIHIEVNLDTEADEEFTQGIVSYLINSEDAQFYPKETWIDGNHVLHLMYILPLEANSMQIFEIYLQSLGGTISIERGGVWLYASGAGLVGDGRWDGTITCQDNATDFALVSMTIENASDSVTVTTQVPTGGSVADNAADFTLVAMTFETAVDEISIRFITESAAMVTEIDEPLMTEEGDRFYTEGD